MAYVYISYSQKDLEVATKLQDALQSRGHTIRIDEQDNVSGRAWTAQIDQAISNAEILIVLLSPDSVESRLTRSAISLARRLQKPIIPVLVQRASLPRALVNLQVIDATGDWDKAVESLNQAIEASANLV